jgi:hypothetical protein
MDFYLTNLDFSIFGDYILISDTRQNKFTMSKNLYMKVIKSILVNLFQLNIILIHSV